MLINDNEGIGFLMHDVARMMRYGFDARARDMGVTRPQWRALLHMARAPGLTQAELADQLDVERITLCRMIDRLAEANLVERRSDASDRRVWRLHLLPAAHDIVGRLAEIGSEMEEAMLAPLSADERRELTCAIERMRDALRSRGGDQRKEVA